MNTEASTPPNPPSNSHPALALVSRIDILDTKLRLLELYVTEAQTAAAADGKKMREQFQAELSALQTEVKQKEATLETHQALAQQADRNQRKQIQELRAELLEANRLAESRQTELTANKLAATALRERINWLETEAEKNRVESTRRMGSLLEQITQLERANDHAERNRADVSRLQSQYESELAALRRELAEKSDALETYEARECTTTARHARETAELRAEMAAAKNRLDDNGLQLEGALAENRRLQDRLEAVTVVHEQALADAQTAIETRTEEYRRQVAALEQRVAESAKLQQRSYDDAQVQSLQAALAQAGEAQKRQGEQADLKIQDLQRAREALENQLAEARHERQQQQEQLNNELRQVTQQLVEKQQALEERGREREALQSQASQLRQQVAHLEEAKWLQAEEHSRTAERFNQQLQGLGAQLSDKEQQIAAREQELAALQGLAQQLREQWVEQEALQQQRAEEHAAAVDTLQQELQRAGDQLNAAQQTAAARDNDLHQLRAQAQQLGEQLAALQQDRRQAAAAHDAQTQSLEGRLRHIADQLTAKQQRVEAVECELEDLRNASRELHRQIADLHQAREHTASEHRSAIEAWHDRQRQFEAQIEEMQQLVAARDREAADLHETARQLRDRLQQQEQTQQQAAAEQADKIRHLEANFTARAQEFEATLAQQSDLLAQRIAELETLRGQTGSLDERIKRLQGALEQSDAEKHETEERRAALQRRLDDLQRAFDGAQGALHVQQGEFSALRQTLEAERSEHAQRAVDWNQCLQAKEADLQRAQATLDELNRQLKTFEAAHQEQLQSAAREVEQSREQHHAELIALRDELHLKEAALDHGRAELADAEMRLNSAVQELSAELTREQTRRQRGEQELADANGAVEALRARIAEFEALATESDQKLAARFDQLRADHATELELLQGQLQEKEQARATQESQWRAREEQARAELTALQQAQAEKQTLVEQREGEIANLQREADELRAQWRQAEVGYKNALHANLSETEQRFTTELALRQVAILQLQNELAANQRHTGKVEQSLTAQVNALQTQLDEKDALLGQRAAALNERSRELDTLQERLGLLQRTNEALANDGQKLDEAFRLRFSELESALADGAAHIEQRSAELENAQAEVSALRQHILMMEELHQHSQREHHAVRNVLQEDLDRALQALTQKSQDFEAEAAALQAARAQVAEELRVLQADLSEREVLVAERDRESAGLRAEIDALTAQLADRQTAALRVDEAGRATVEQAQRQAAAQLAEQEALLSESLAVQQAQQIELAAWREQAAGLEELRRQGERADENQQRAEQLSAELGVLKADLADKERALTRHEEQVHALEIAHQERLSQLQVQLAQHQLLAESRARQTEDLRSNITVLQEQITALETNGREFVERQRVEFAAAETALRIDIDELQKQIAEDRAIIEARNIEIGALQNEKQALQGEIERLATAGLRLNNLNAESKPATYGDQLLEIAHLRAEIVEKQQLLEDRNEKLIHAKGELADLQKSLERIAVAKDGDLTTPAAATDNDLLWEQLGQSDRSSEHSEQAVVNERETGFRVTFDRRHNDAVAEQPRGAAASTDPFASGSEPKAATADEHLGLEFLIRQGKNDGHPLPNNSHDRRWRFSLGKKRRWKS